MFLVRPSIVCLLSLTALLVWTGCTKEVSIGTEPVASRHGSTKDDNAGDGSNAKLATAILAGGCFWCVESDFDKLPGVIDVVSGYSGGSTENPTYKNYTQGGHREVVKVVYDPAQVNFSGLVEWLFKHCDPTDANGSFNDRGKQYAPAVYYENDTEKKAAEAVITAVDEMNVFKKKIAIDVLPREKFWPAEEYHQDYHSKSLIKYDYYRFNSGRDNFIKKNWGDRAKKLELPSSIVEAPKAKDSTSQSSEPDRKAITVKSEERGMSETPWESFKKPSEAELRKQLNKLQFDVTQQEGTEPPYNNEYWNNHQAGIYVDVVSGEPLFSSADKFESGTGWPSFVQPLDSKFIKLKQDRSLLATRIEVRSKLADSHVGHVFDDGPADRGGKRYCMNSAAMRFVPQQEMEAKGYGNYLEDVAKPEH